MREEIRKSYEAFSYMAPVDHPMRLGWPTKDDQRIRFEALLKLAGNLSGKVVHDAGCGLGDLIPLLGPVGRYVGSEGYEPNLAVARARFPKSRFIQIDLERDTLPPCDVVLASGTLAFYRQKAVFRLIQRMFESASEAVVFNLLTGPRSDGLVTHEPQVVVDFCHTLHGSRVELADNYLPGDISFRVSK